MTNKRKITVGFIVLVAILILGYDLYVAGGPPGDTISEVVLGWSLTTRTRSFFAGLIVGILIGHLFWPQKIGGGDD